MNETEKKKIDRALGHMRKARASLAEAIGAAFPACTTEAQHEWRDGLIATQQKIDEAMRTAEKW